MSLISSPSTIVGVRTISIAIIVHTNIVTLLDV